MRLRVIGFAVCMMAALASFAATAVKFYRTPSRVESDCRLKNVTIDDIKSLEKQEKGGMSGLLNVSAWRYGDAGEAVGPLPGLKGETGAVYVYGSMPLAFPATVLSGSYDQSMEEDDCVLTKALSFKLFGSTDTSGCRLTFNGKDYRVAAVIDKKEEILMLPAREGKVETVVFLFKDRGRIKDWMRAQRMQSY